MQIQQCSRFKRFCDTLTFILERFVFNKPSNIRILSAESKFVVLIWYHLLGPAGGDVPNPYWVRLQRRWWNGVDHFKVIKFTSRCPCSRRHKAGHRGIVACDTLNTIKSAWMYLRTVWESWKSGISYPVTVREMCYQKSDTVFFVSWAVNFLKLLQDSGKIPPK